MYREPLPWRKIIGISFSITFIIFTFILELQRRKRKAALERYHLRRLNRKFKLANNFDEIYPEEPDRRDTLNTKASGGSKSRRAFFVNEKQDEKFSWEKGKRETVYFQSLEKHKTI
jgi:hypothetical protein